MPDQADPVADLLRKAPASDAIRAAAWDAFHQSASVDDFAAKVKGLALPDSVKADLWDLKQQSAPTFTSANEKDAAGDAVVRPALNRFGEQLYQKSPVAGLVDLGLGTYHAVTHPLDTY